MTTGGSSSSPRTPSAVLLTAVGAVAAVVGPRLVRRSAGPVHDPIVAPPVDPESVDPEPGLAHRRATIELHRRSLDAALVALADRECFETELRAGDSSRSVVAVTFADVTLAGVTFAGVTFAGVTFAEELVDQAMRRLSSIVRQDTTVHRVGRSELIVVVLGDRYVADSIARRVTEAFRSPFSVGGRDLVAVIGVGIASVDPSDPETAVRRADLAARRAADLTN